MGLISSLSLLLLFSTLALADDNSTDIPAYLLPIDGLDYNYYKRSCPDMQAIIQNKVKDLISKDSTYGASLIRLHFHDCAVRGCDASILLDQPMTSEKYADASKTLRGFEFIEDIKTELEKSCPQTVSCADILATVARDATNVIGGPYWPVKYGRKDGRISLAEEANAVPMGKESVTDLIEYFQAMGLSVVDLVTLSGAHTIGRSSCGSIQHRLYNFKGTGKPDTTINPQYLNFLQRKCQQTTEYTDLDATTPTIFDNVYYKNIQMNMGLLETDQKLIVDSRTGPLVTANANQANLFYLNFGASMLKLGRVNVLTGDEGEIRLKCSSVN